MNRIAEISAHSVRLPLKEPFETAKRRATESEAIMVELKTDHGLTGLGEATPVGYVTGETIVSVISAIESAADALVGRPVRSFASIAGTLMAAMPNSPGARAAIEMAVIDAAGQEAGEPSYELLGGQFRTVETDLTIPVVAPAHAAELARAAAALGFTIFKMKAAGVNPDEDMARAVAIAQVAVGCRLIIDANQGFAPKAAVAFMREVVRRGVEVALFEQPVDAADIEGLAYVSHELDTPVFADESAQTPADVLRLVRHSAVDGVNVKLMKSGVFAAMEIASICEKHDLGQMIGCMIEPPVGIAAALHVVCASRGFAYFDLDADLLLADAGTGGFHRDGPRLSPLTSPGLGFLPAV